MMVARSKDRRDINCSFARRRGWRSHLSSLSLSRYDCVGLEIFIEARRGGNEGWSENGGSLLKRAFDGNPRGSRCHCVAEIISYTSSPWCGFVSIAAVDRDSTRRDFVFTRSRSETNAKEKREEEEGERRGINKNEGKEKGEGIKNARGFDRPAARSSERRVRVYPSVRY